VSAPGRRAAGERPVSADVVWHEGAVARSERWAASRLGGATVWFTGLSGSGKSTVAVAVERRLLDAGRAAYVLDGDNLRHGLNGDLGFGAADRTENVRRAAEVARLFADAGLVALVPLISPFRADRDRARAVHVDAGLPFLEVFVDTPLVECERRDPKGLYARARAGELPGFTGVDDPYEPPSRADLVLRPDDGDPDAQAALVVALVDQSRTRGL
jgi:bifunctional enzyme CysN/CysC